MLISRSRLLAIVAGVSLLLASRQYAQADTAEEMVSACQKMKDAKVSAGTVKFHSDFDSGVCWGASAAFQKVITFEAGNGTLLLGVCAPEEARRKQYIKRFLAYAKRHPERLMRTS